MDPSIQIVEDVELAEALLDQYEATFERLGWSSPIETRLEQDAAIGGVDQIYPEIWQRLDRARAAARAVGRDLSIYEALRAAAGIDVVHGVASTTATTRIDLVGGVPVLATSRRTATANVDGAHAARQAIAWFRAAFHDLAWHPIDAAVPELRTGRFGAVVLALLGGAAVVGGILVFYVMRR